MKTTTPLSPHAEYMGRLKQWKATTKRVQPLTLAQMQANVKAAQRHADSQGKAERVAKAKKQAAASEKTKAQHNR
jgi:ABC-type uncharacterized transport system fused permease/ATPase subunit